MIVVSGVASKFGEGRQENGEAADAGRGRRMVRMQADLRLICHLLFVIRHLS